MEQVSCSDSTAGAPALSKRPTVAEIYEIAGRFLLFESPGPLPNGLTRLLQGFYFQPAHGAHHSPDATICFQPQTSLPAIPITFDRFEVSDGAMSFTDGSTYVFDFGAWRVVINPASSRVDVLMTEELDLEQLEHVQVFNYALSAALRRCGLYELHSGAVIAPGGDAGILFAGPSGSGKSTLTLQLVVSGWKYLTDDILLLDEQSSSVQAMPLRRAFAVTDTTLSATRHHELMQTVISRDWFDASKKRFAPDDFFPGKFAAGCVPRVICFPIVTQLDQSSVQELSPSEAMIKLVKLCPWASYDRGTSRDHLRVLGALAKQCKTFELRTGRDLLGDPARISQFVSTQVLAKVE